MNEMRASFETLVECAYKNRGEKKNAFKSGKLLLLHRLKVAGFEASCVCKLGTTYKGPG